MTTITFSEDVTGFDDTSNDVTLGGTAVSGATISAINAKTGSPGVYEVTITPNSNGMKGELVISVPAGAATDTAGNDNIASSMSATVDYNPNAPTVTISEPSGMQTTAFVVTVTFSEAVTDFMPNDISLSGATASIGTPTGNAYPVTITPTTDGTLTISIPAGVVMDAVDTETDYNVASNKVTVVVDVNPPTVTEIAAPDTHNSGNTFDVTITFSEDVTLFDPSDLTLTNATAAGSWSSQTERVYTGAITPTITDGNAGEVTIHVPAGAAQDGADRGNTASGTKSVTVDRERPTVSSITVPSGPQNGDFDVTITFSEPVSGFESSELTVSTGANAPLSWSSGGNGDMTYTGTINTSGVSSSDDSVDVTISVPSRAAEDAAKNGNFASDSSVDETVTVDKKEPTPTIDAVSGTKSSAFTITINFDENVINFGLNGISLTKQSGDATGTTSSINKVNAAEYTATITPSGTGTLRISVSASAAEDDAGNASVASMNVDVSVDTSGPTPTITAPGDPQNTAFDVTIDFGESVTGFTKSEITLGGAANYTTGSLTGSGASYTLRITPTGSGMLTIDVAAGVATDNNGNSNEAASQVMVDIDVDAPTLTIDAPSDPQNGNTFDVTFTFDEDVTGFEPRDVTVTNANKASSWQSGATATTYVLRLTPDATAGEEETVTIDVAAGGATDAANNGNEAATQASVMVDKKRPTVSISGVPLVSDEQNDEFDLTIMFNEDVSDFTTDDLIFTPTGRATATAVAAVSGSERNYTATITPNTAGDGVEGNVTVKVRGTAAEDAAGNRSIVSAATSAIHIDTIEPTATISGLPTGEENGLFNVTITFNENVSDFAEEDLRVTGEATVNGVSGSGRMYTADISPNDDKEGEVTVQVNADAVTDAAGNSNPASTATPNIHIDTIEPTGMYVDAPTTPQKDPFDVTLRFSERVSGFDLSEDVPEQPKNAVITLKSRSANGRNYVLTVTPAPDTGQSDIISVSRRAVEDDAGNYNESVIDLNFTVDTIVPTVSISGVPTGKQKDAFPLTITFSETVTGFAADDLIFTPTGRATVTRVTGSDTTYTATITPGADQNGDTVRVRVKGNAAKDAAGNDSTVSADTSDITLDTVRPTVVIENVPADAQNKDFQLAVRFSERVTDFDLNDVSLTGPATATEVVVVTGTIGLYRVAIFPNDAADGEVTAKINAGVVTDEAGNTNTASATVRFRVDTRPPTAEFSGVPDAPKKDPFTVTLTFSEPVIDFEIPDDLKATLNTMTVALHPDADDAAVYELRVTPRPSIDGNTPESIIIESSAVEDNAGNFNIVEFSTGEIVIDTIVPTVSISGLPTGEQKDAFPLTITFSEDVNGFAAADLMVTGGVATATVAPVGASKMNYIATITPNAISEGDVTVTVRADTVTDPAGNPNTASTATRNIHVDTIAPTATISVPPLGVHPLGGQKDAFNDAFDLTIMFNEDVSGFATADLMVNGEATVTAVAAKPGSESEYTATITPNADSEGDVTVRVNANAVTDAAGNQNPVSDPTSAIPIDTRPPVITMEIYNARGNELVTGDPPALTAGTGPSNFIVYVTASENVTGFSASEDFMLTGPATFNQVNRFSGPTVWGVRVTRETRQDGLVNFFLKADAVTDAAGNTSALSDTYTILVDTLRPEVESITGEPITEQNGPFDLTVTFSEPVFDFEAGFGNDVRWGTFIPEPGTPEPDSQAVLFQFELIQGDDGDSVYNVSSE